MTSYHCPIGQAYSAMRIMVTYEKEITDILDDELIPDLTKIIMGYYDTYDEYSYLVGNKKPDDSDDDSDNKNKNKTSKK